jgi:hypothetical protein
VSSIVNLKEILEEQSARWLAFSDERIEKERQFSADRLTEQDATWRRHAFFAMWFGFVLGFALALLIT